MVDPFIISSSNYLHQDFDWNDNEPNDPGTDTCSTPPLGLSSSKGGKAAEGKDPNKFLSQNLLNGIIDTKKFIFYINIQAILFNHTLI
jgi:hypothetical protein